MYKYKLPPAKDQLEGTWVGPSSMYVGASDVLANNPVQEGVLEDAISAVNKDDLHYKVQGIRFFADF